MRRKCLALTVVFCGAAYAFAAVEETTSEPVNFKMYIIGGGTYALTSAADFASWHVMWRAGDTVTATPAVGETTTLVDGAAVDGAAALPQHKGGLWTLQSSRFGTAEVGVPWSVFSDGGELAASTAASGKLDTSQAGPDRCTDKWNVLPVAYSGDNWAGDVAKASVVTFTPPEGSGLSETVWNRNGSGVDAFTFGVVGLWTVTLKFEDGTTRTAKIDILTSGLTISIK